MTNEGVAVKIILVSIIQQSGRKYFLNFEPRTEEIGEIMKDYS